MYRVRHCAEPEHLQSCSVDVASARRGMSQRIFLVGRVRRRPRDAAVRPADSLATAGRRQRRRREPSPAPTLTSLAMVAGWVSNQRIAGDGDVARQERAAILQQATDRAPSRLGGGDEVVSNDVSVPTLPRESHVPPVAFAPVPLLAASGPLDPAHVGMPVTAPTVTAPRETVAAPPVAAPPVAAPAVSARTAPPVPEPAQGAEVDIDGAPTMNDRSSIDAPSVEATSAIAAAPPIAAAAPITAAAVVAAAVAPTARHAVPRTPRNEPNRVALNRITADRAPAGAKPAAATKTPKPPKPPKPPKLPEEKSGDRPPDRRGSRKILGWTMVGLGVVILGGMAWVGLRTYQAYSHLQNASTDVTELQAQLTDITNSDPAVIGATVAHLQDESAAAHSAVDDPIYRVATAVPFLGANLDAIRTVTVTVDSLATDVMPSLVNVAQKLQPSEIAPKDGTINLAPIQEISPLLQSADVAVNAARQNLATIDQSSVIQPVGDAVQTLSTKLANAAGITGP